MIKDITKKSKSRQAEVALKESKERYRSLFHQAISGILIVAENGKVIAVNESFARMHGYSLSEMQNMDIRDTDYRPAAPLTDGADAP